MSKISGMNFYFLVKLFLGEIEDMPPDFLKQNCASLHYFQKSNIFQIFYYAIMNIQYNNDKLDVFTLVVTFSSPLFHLKQVCFSSKEANYLLF